MKLIHDWVNKKLRCYFCGEMRSVKYIMEIFNPVESDKLIEVYVCNKCALRSISINNNFMR